MSKQKRNVSVLCLCCSWEKGKPTCLSPELKVQAKEWFFCINIERTTKRTLQVKLFAQFLHLYTNWCLLFSSPLRGVYFVIMEMHAAEEESSFFPFKSRFLFCHWAKQGAGTFSSRSQREPGTKAAEARHSFAV